MSRYDRAMTSRILLAFTAALIGSAPALAQSDFSGCLSGLRGQAAAKGISGETFHAAFGGAPPEMSVLELVDSQPEFKTPIWDYLAMLVNEERVADGRAAMSRWSN